MRRFQALAIGGGPAGSALAIQSARLGQSVCLVEGCPDGGFKVGESLPPALRPLLRDLGALPACDAEGALLSYGNRSSWGSATIADTDFIRDPYGPGWHVDRPRFDARLRELAAAAGACVMAPCRLRRVTRVAGLDAGWEVVLASADRFETCRARWIVDCTGRSAWFAQRQGARRIVYDRLVAVAGVFAADYPDADSRTLVESVAEGWWYSSLVPGGRRMVVFLGDAVRDAVRMRRDPAAFHQRLRRTSHVGPELHRHGYRLQGQLRVGTANSARLSHFAGPGWLAAGDAALSFDPLSSQGILTALFGGMQAAQAIHEGSVERYSERLAAVFEIYLRNRDLYYAEERRWPDEPFWRARRPQ